MDKPSAGGGKMSSFISALMKQRRDAKKAQPDTNGRLKEIIAVLKKYNYDDGITPEITVNILQDLGPTFVKIGQIASQQAEYIPPAYCDALKKKRNLEIPGIHESRRSQRLFLPYANWGFPSMPATNGVAYPVF